MKKHRKKLKESTMSLFRFVVLSLLTLGMYEVYWTWKVWETVRQSKRETYRIPSSVRSYASLLTNFRLFPQLQELAQGKKYRKGVNVESLAGLYLIAGLLNGSRNIFLVALGLVSGTLSLLPIVTMHNYYVEQTGGKFTPTKINWPLILFLSICFILVVIIFLNPSMEECLGASLVDRLQRW